MVNIKALSNILSITYDNKQLTLLDIKELEWYVDNCRQNYFNTYLDFDFARDIKAESLKTLLYDIVIGYKLQIASDSEARFVLKDTDIDRIVAGCTLKEQKDTLELAYWVLPEFQGNHIAHDMLHNLIKATSQSQMKFTRFRATIQDRNVISKKLVEGLRFINTGQHDGKYGINDVYILEREK